MGNHWNGQSSNDQGGYDIGIAVSNTDTTILSTAGINIWGSTNGGINYAPRTYWVEWDNQAPVTVHADHHTLVYNELNNRLFSCNDGGLYYSVDNGINWINISKGLVISQFYHLAQFRNSSFMLSGGQQDKGVKYRGSGSDVYSHIGPGDGFQTAFQANNSKVVYCTINQGGNKINPITGLSYPFNMPDNNGGFFKSIMANNTDSTKVYVGGPNAFYASSDQGITWTTNSTVSGYHAMDQSLSSPNTMYIAGGASYIGAGNIWRTTDGAANWANLTTNTGFPTGFTRITDISIDPFSSTSVYVTFGGFTANQKVFFSNDGGSNWQNFSFNLPNVVVHCVKVANGKVYVGTDLGVFRRDFNTSTWYSIRDNMPKTPVTDVFVDGNTGNIICSTFGRGVWQRDFCVDNMQLTGQLLGKLDYKSNIQITSTSVIPGINDVDSILMQSGKIILQPGFKAKTGTHMNAIIGPCDNGTQPIAGRLDTQEIITGKKKDE